MIQLSSMQHKQQFLIRCEDQVNMNRWVINAFECERRTFYSIRNTLAKAEVNNILLFVNFIRACKLIAFVYLCIELPRRKWIVIEYSFIPGYIWCIYIILRETLLRIVDRKQTTMYTILVLAFFVLTVIRDVRSRVVEQSIRSCMTSNDDRQPLLIDTDTDIDDLWAIHYILNVNEVICPFLHLCQ